MSKDVGKGAIVMSKKIVSHIMVTEQKQKEVSRLEIYSVGKAYGFW